MAVWELVASERRGVFGAWHLNALRVDLGAAVFG
jgi:hypothetical protein